MDKVGKPTGLVRRGGTWYFRARIPKDLIKIFGANDRWRSLKTSDYRLAIERHSEVVAEWKAALAAARRKARADASGTATTPAQRDHPLATDDDIRRLAISFFDEERRRLDDYDEPGRADLEPETAKEVAADLEVVLGTLSSREDPDTLRQTGHEANRLLAAAGLTVVPGSAEEQRLREFIRRALLAIALIERRRFNGDYSDAIADALFAGTRSVSVGRAGPASLTIKDAADRFWREEIEIETPSAKTRSKYKATLDHVVDFFGRSAPIASLDRAQCLAFRDMIADLPPNFTKGKRRAGVSASDLARMNADGSLGRMAYDTQSTYVTMMGRFVEWAHIEGIIPADFARNIRPRATKVPREDRRDPFTAPELKAIFNAPLYRGCQDDEHRFAKPGPNVSGAVGSGCPSWRSSPDCVWEKHCSWPRATFSSRRRRCRSSICTGTCS